MPSFRHPAALVLALAVAPLLTAVPAAAQDGPAHLVRDVDTTGEVILYDPPCFGFCPAPQELFGSQPSQLLAVGNRVYFAADDRTHGAEIWRSDGTAGGTVRVTDVCPGACGSNPLLLGSVGGEVFFWADDGAAGMELWKTDGTAGGTTLVRDVCPGPCDGYPAWELAWIRSEPLLSGTLGGSLYFEARPRPDSQTPTQGSVWRTDGTPAGTEEVLALCSAPECAGEVRAFAPVGSGLLVSARDLDEDRAGLWRLGPAGEAPELVALTCSQFAQPPHGFVRLGDRVLFASWCLEPAPFTPANGVSALYATDGTAAGTTVVHATGSQVGVMPRFRLGAHVYFHGPEGLWRTDGTPAGTELALPRPPGVLGIEEPVPFQGAIFFLGVGDDLEFHLWRTAQGAESPRLLLENSSSGLTPMANVLFFRSSTPETGSEPWITDGTERGTRLFQDIRPGPASSAFHSLVRAGDRIFFSADDGVHDRELWAVRLAAAGPPPPPAPPITSAAFPDFRFWVRITGAPGDSRLGVREAACLPETVCVSGAVPGRSEVFLRVVGPKPNGKLWPTLVKFSTSTVEIWVEQESSGETRYYHLPGARPGVDELPGLFDRQGFEP